MFSLSSGVLAQQSGVAKGNVFTYEFTANWQINDPNFNGIYLESFPNTQTYKFCATDSNYNHSKVRIEITDISSERIDYDITYFLISGNITNRIGWQHGYNMEELVKETHDPPSAWNTLPAVGAPYVYNSMFQPIEGWILKTNSNEIIFEITRNYFEWESIYFDHMDSTLNYDNTVGILEKCYSTADILTEQRGNTIFAERKVSLVLTDSSVPGVLSPTSNPTATLNPSPTVPEFPFMLIIVVLVGVLSLSIITIRKRGKVFSRYSLV
jgi:hypothetical protein